MNTNINRLNQYYIIESDFKNLRLVEAKMKAESIIGLFIALENIIAPIANPEIADDVAATKHKLLNYIDEYFINQNGTIATDERQS